MPIDKAATKAARASHEAGVKRLNKLFAWTGEAPDPTPRYDREAKRRRRKIAHESRRRNR
jgi:hypothetical protein